MTWVPCPKSDGGTCYFQDVAVVVHQGSVGIVGGPALAVILGITEGNSSDVPLARHEVSSLDRLSGLLSWARGESLFDEFDYEQEVASLADSQFIQSIAETDEDFVIGECTPCGDVVKRRIRR